MEQFLICNDHQKEIVHVGRDANSNKVIAKCGMCLPFQEGVPYQRIIDTLNNIENNKNVMINHFEEQKNYNVKTIRELIEELNKFKNEQVTKIQNTIKYGESEISRIEKECNLSQKKIKEYNTSLDIKDLIDLFNTLHNESSLQVTQEKLLESLININQQQSLLESYKILQQLPYPLNFNLLNEENSKNLKKFYKCPKHSKILIGIDMNQTQESNSINQSCFVCATDAQNASLNYTLLDEAEKKWKDYHDHSISCYQGLQKLVQDFASHTMSISKNKYNNLQVKLEQFQRILEKYKNSKLQKLSQIFQSLQFSQLDFFSIENLKQLAKISKLSEQNWRNYDTEINSFYCFLEKQNIQITICISRVNELIRLIMNGLINQVTKTKIKFDQISSVQQQETCYAIAINSEGNILVAGFNEKINVFEFNSGFLTKLQQLDGHSQDVYCLQFMKNKDVFVSASDDKTIKIWKQQQARNWSIIQTLEGLTGQIFCLVINQRGDQIISGGSDNQITFWVQNNQEWSSSQIISVHERLVCGLCLNESENKLISCGWDDLILVMEQVQKNEWSIIQKIQTAYGCTLCFITDDSFSFQPNKGYLQLYKYNNQQNIFVQAQTVEVPDNKNIQYSHFLFPQKFIKSKQVLISKHKNYLNIVRRIRNEQFNVDQSIKFKERYHYFGTISDDGQYLVTWDRESRQIKVRNCKTLLDSN